MSELLRKKSSIDQFHQLPQDRSTSSSRRLSVAINDDINSVSKAVTPQLYERTSSIHSRPLTRSNSINPAYKDHEKSSSGERSYHTSAAQSRRVSISLNRSPVRAEELERVLTKLVNEEIQALENYRRTSVKSRTSLRERYLSLLEEKKHELDDLKQQADVTLSRPTTSTRERRPTDLSESNTRKRLSFSHLDGSTPSEPTINIENPKVIIKHDQQQQTSFGDSRPASAQKEKSSPQIIQNDQYKVPFFHLYETIYKFRHSIMNLLEQNKFSSLADHLEMIKQLSSSLPNDTTTNNNNHLADDFVDNSERALKDTIKVLQTCMATLISTINQRENEQNQSPTTLNNNPQSSIIQEKESTIDDLNQKYQQITEEFNQNNKKYQEELIQNEQTIVEQQKLIQNFQQELIRLQTRLSKKESEGIVQPNIMFTRLDVEHRSTSSSRRLSVAINDDINSVSKAVTPQLYERTSSIHSRPLTRSNSINPAYKDHEKSSSGERSYHTSAAQSRRVSISLNRSPVRAEELERVLTKLVNEEIQALENYRRTSVKSRTSLRERYLSLLEEKKHELDDLKQQADVTLSRPTTSTRERRPTDLSESNTRKRLSFSHLDGSTPSEPTINIENPKVIIKHDQQQQTSFADSRPASAKKEKSSPQIIQNDQYKVPFFHLYETIYKFRHSIMNLLEQNKFSSLADHLEMIKQLSSSLPNDTTTTNNNNHLADDFVDNSERALKDTIKVLQTCMATLISTINQRENEQNQSPTTLNNNPQSSIIQEKESTIDDLNQKYQQITEEFNQNNKKYQEELIHNEQTIVEQQKLIQNFQQELIRLQRRLSKKESEGIVQPNIMFTRLDVERNEQTLKQAADKGKLSEKIVNDINESMEDYIRLPCRQFSNIVKRYIQHRKAAEVKNLIQNETLDNEAKNNMEKMESYYEQRSGQISEHIASIRQHRATLARTLTDKFDHLEHDNSIFLIRPIYSYQGRTTVKSSTENKKQRQSRENNKKETHKKSESRNDQNSDTSENDDEKLFHINESFTPTTTTPQLNELPHLQEYDIQRTLLPVSHTSTNSNNGIDTSSNLRTYVPLTRPNLSGNKKSNTNVKNPVISTDVSSLSVNPPTTMNSSVSDIRRSTPPLPPIKSSLNSSTSRSIDEKQNNESTTNDGTDKDKNINQEK
ncbi:unnamed protein product [Adineta steineri]|uniref:Uncharacterized protein n=3 Tax=Adineta steineri TaxID=433720 RepID=A0A815QQN2_9BILA|nr:unnamed protein product [Adineta steineri]